jgi:transposase InsO family protein
MCAWTTARAHGVRTAGLGAVHRDRHCLHRSRPPWQNGHCESFNGRFRDEFLATEQFDTLMEAQGLAEDWRIE